MSLGLVHAHYLWDWPAAERHYRRALELNPSSSAARQWVRGVPRRNGAHRRRAGDSRASEDGRPALARHPWRRKPSRCSSAADSMTRLPKQKLALEIDPGYAMALIRLALAYRRQRG